MAKRMLLAEDDPDNRGIVVKVLTREGYQTFEAGPTATPPWPSARRERLDLIVADLGMPEMDGSGASRQAKADPQTVGIPVIRAHRNGPAGGRGAATGRDPARRDDARGARHAGAPLPEARPEERLDPGRHGDRQGRGPRPAGRLRGRRRLLRHQAVHRPPDPLRHRPRARQPRAWL